MPPGDLSQQVQIALDYFNERRFHDSYEVLERVWRISGGPERPLYQGIIQIAGAAEKLLGGNWRGAVSLFETGLQLIVPFRPAHLGIDVADLHLAAEACLNELLLLGEERLSEFDPTHLPAIQRDRSNAH